MYSAPGASLTVTGSTFSGNTATGVSSTGQDGRGGAIYNSPGAIFSATDDTFAANTAQSQKGHGIDGFAVVGDKTLYPAYATVSIAGTSLYTWASSTTDPRALQKSAPTASDRVSATLYSGSSFTVDSIGSNG